VGFYLISCGSVDGPYIMMSDASLVLLCCSQRCMYCGKNSSFGAFVHPQFLTEYKYSRYHFPVLFGSELLIHIFNQRIFLLAVSIAPYIVNGKVWYWKPMSLSWAVYEVYKICTFGCKISFGFLSLDIGMTKSTVHIEAYKTLYELMNPDDQTWK
jgi:hypothetical protein